MNREAEILKEHSKRHTVDFARLVGNDERRFRRLMELFLKGGYQVAQRSPWILSTCAENHPALVLPYLGKMITRMQEPGVHDAVKRNLVRILQFIDIPDNLLGEVTMACFAYLASPNEPIAVRCFSMTVLANIALKEPDLKRELKLIIERHLSHGGPAFRARAKMVLKMIA